MFHALSVISPADMALSLTSMPQVHLIWDAAGIVNNMLGWSHV